MPSSGRTAAARDRDDGVRLRRLDVELARRRDVGGIVEHTALPQRRVVRQRCASRGRDVLRPRGEADLVVPSLVTALVEREFGLSHPITNASNR